MNTGNVKCPYCTRSFKNKWALGGHIKVHNKHSKSFQLDTSDEEYNDDDYANDSFKEYANDSANEYVETEYNLRSNSNSNSPSSLNLPDLNKSYISDEENNNQNDDDTNVKYNKALQNLNYIQGLTSNITQLSYILKEKINDIEDCFCNAYHSSSHEVVYLRSNYNKSNEDDDSVIILNDDQLHSAKIKADDVVVEEEDDDEVNKFIEEDDDDDDNDNTQQMNDAQIVLTLQKAKKKLQSQLKHHKNRISVAFENEIIKLIKKQTSLQCEVNTAFTLKISEIDDVINKQKLLMKIKNKNDQHYQCEYCSKKFQSSNFLKHHLNQQHTQVLNQYICNLCGKYSSSNKHLCSKKK